jgi:hypothetical protein
MLISSPEVVGDMNDLDHVSVAADGELGALVGDELKSELYFDYTELKSTLGKLGEFESGAGVPLSIDIAATRQPHWPGAMAYAWVDENDKLTERSIWLPIFTVEEQDEEYCWASYDAEEFDAKFLHELKHVVDFLNPRLLNEQLHYRKKDQRKRDYLYGGISGAFVAEAGAMQLIGNSGARVLSAAVCLAGLRVCQLMRRTELKPGQFGEHQYSSHAAYLKDPLELRSYGTVDEYTQNDNVPSIVRLAKNTALRTK